jgi:ribosomal protein S18 acetylase RimI-like enzyme
MQLDVIVTVCPDHLLPDVCRLLFSNSPEEEESSTPDQPDANREPTRIVVALRNDQLLGAMQYHLGVGRVGWLGKSSVTEAGSRCGLSLVTRGLARHATGRLAAEGARLVQAILAPDDVRAEPITQCGFEHITDIAQMDRSTRGNLSDARCTNFDFVPYSDSLWDPLCRLVERTYLMSFDCPELDGIRPVADVLRGYRSAGNFIRESWTLVRVDGYFAGCVLQAFFPDCSLSSVQYMGVMPESRRRGVGRALAQHAVRNAAKLGMELIDLAVDIRNIPALRLYRGLDFVERERRCVFIKRVGSEEE